jgi:gluconate 2-dehydrogenase gamma chain
VGHAVPQRAAGLGQGRSSCGRRGPGDGGIVDGAALQTLTAACERIIPADDTPGATAAGVPAFIERMLTDWYDQPERARVTAGIESLDTLGRARHSRAFVDCTTTEQDAILLELDRDGPAHWFGTVKYLTIWGYFTSEVGMVRELGQWPSPGHYDGCAPYSPRPRKAQV